MPSGRNRQIPWHVRLWQFSTHLYFLTVTVIILIMAAFTAPLSVAAHTADLGDDVYIGVLAYDQPEIVTAQLAPLVDSLQPWLKDIDFHLKVMDTDDLEAMARASVPAVIITSPYHYLRLRGSDGLTGAFATISRASSEGPITSMAGTIVVLAGRDDLADLADLKGATVAIGDRRNTGGYVLPLLELRRVGVDRDDLKWIETGVQEAALGAMLRGEADAAFLRSSLLEALVSRGEVDRAAVRVLNPQRLGDFPFVVSTHLFPEWPLVATSGTHPDIVSRILDVALLHPPAIVDSIPGAFAGLGAPADYSGLAVALSELGLFSYDAPPSFTLADILRTYKVELIVALLFWLVVMTLLLALAQRSWRMRTLWGELHRAVREQEADRKRVQALNTYFETFLARTTDFVYFKDASSRYIFVSKSFATLVGFDDRRDVDGKTDLDVFPPEIAAEYVQQEAELFRSRKPVVDLRQRFKRSDGSIGWVSTYKWPVFSEDESKVVGLFGISRDVTDLHDNEQQLQRAAHYDGLTGLPNRVLLFDRLHQAMASAERRGSELAVVYVDIDKFKNINDLYGHAIGDQLLVQVSEIFRSQLRRSDTSARMGGDEFVFLIADFTSRKECMTLLDRTLAAIAAPRVIGGARMSVTASAGIVFYGPGMTLSAEDLLRQADKALYQAKDAGRNRYRVTDEQQGVGQRGFLQQIEQGMQRQEFELFFQPVVDMRSGAVVGAEALLRWRRGDGELLSPDRFLPMMVGDPLAIELEHWALQEALEQQARWRRQGVSFCVHVNVTALDISQPEFVARLKAVIERSGCDVAGCITLEILESAAVADADRVNSVIAQCRDLGVNFALDDFGTGYSSLSHIKDLRASAVKIDERFVQAMHSSYDDFALLMAILAMARAFDREVVAEGVETLEQGEMLLRLGCPFAQGFAIARPMPVAQFEAWMAEWQLPERWRNIDNESAAIPSHDSALGRALWDAHVAPRSLDSCDRQPSPEMP